MRYAGGGEQGRVGSDHPTVAVESIRSARTIIPKFLGHPRFKRLERRIEGRRSVTVTDLDSYLAADY